MSAYGEDFLGVECAWPVPFASAELTMSKHTLEPRRRACESKLALLPGFDSPLADFGSWSGAVAADDGDRGNVLAREAAEVVGHPEHGVGALPLARPSRKL